MAQSKILIRNGTVLTMDPGLGILNGADVLIDNDSITEIAPGLAVDGAEVIEAADMIVMPGFVDTHRHVWQTQLRTVATDWSLADYFVQMRLGYSSGYRPDDAYLGNYAGALEALYAGITTVVDHCHIINTPDHADEAVRGLGEAGIRGVFCYGLFASPTHHPFRYEAEPTWRFDDARRIKQRYFASDDGLLQMGLAPMEVDAEPFAQAADEVRFAREIDAKRISCHVAMGGYDSGNRFVQKLADAGLMDSDLLLVHGATLTDDELSIIADTGAGISTTPETEMQMGMGQPVVPRALEKSALVSLGIDIVSNYSGDMFAQMRLQLQGQRANANDHMIARGELPFAIQPSAAQILELATVSGARVAGLDTRIGSLTPGKQADVILIRTDSINMTPMTDPVGAVVLNANVHDVDTVFVAGRAVKRAGALVGVDWPTVAARLNASRDHIVAEFAKLDVEQLYGLFAEMTAGSTREAS